jgi:hypothetical protein
LYFFFALHARVQRVLCILQHLSATVGKGPAGAVDVECQHGHGRAERLSLAPLLPNASEKRQFLPDYPQRLRLKIERIAVLSDIGRPFGLFAVHLSNLRIMRPSGGYTLLDREEKAHLTPLTRVQVSEQS